MRQSLIYATTNEQVTAGGPTGPQNFAPAEELAVAQQSRVVRIGAVQGAPGETVRVPITIDAQGEEVGVQFSLNYDPALLSNPQAEAGSDAANNQFFDVNATQTAQGRLGVLLLLCNPLMHRTRQIVVICFQIAANAGRDPVLSFGDEPTRRRVIDGNANALTAEFTGGAVTLARAVATVSAASFAGNPLAGEAIVAAFGQRLATRIEAAASTPLPTTLAGMSVRDSLGGERLAPLFFVSPM